MYTRVLGGADMSDGMVLLRRVSGWHCRHEAEDCAVDA